MQKTPQSQPERHASAALQMPPKKQKQNSPVATSSSPKSGSTSPAPGAALPVTPATAPASAAESLNPTAPLPRGAAAVGGPGAAKRVAAAIAADEHLPWIEDPSLFCLQPALTARTRIMVTSFALLQMNLCQDIVKSFEVAGYFPRQRPLKLRVPPCRNLLLQTGSLLKGSCGMGRKESELMRSCFILSLHCCILQAAT